MSCETRFSFFKQFWQSYSLNNLASLWYSLLITCLQIYIIFRAIHRFSAYISLPWPNGNAPQESIQIYMLFIAISILIVPFFIIVSLMKVGNYANDGRKLGTFEIKKCLRYLDDENETHGTNNDHKSLMKIIWKHLLPIGPMLHLLMAIFFLFPRLITESQLIRHGFLGKADIWKTDLDMMLKKFNGKIFNFFGLVQTINITEHNYIFTDSSTLGHYFIRNSKSLSETFYELDESGKFSPEFLNFLLALLMLTARYPSVFWRVNKQLSLLMTFQMIFTSIQSIIALNAFQVAFKIFVCDPTHLLIRYRESSSLNLPQLSILMFIYLIILQLSSMSLYIFGLQKYREYRYARTKYFQMKYESPLMINMLPYLFAMLFFLMLALSIGPLFYEFAIIYLGSLSFSALLLLLSTIIYFIFWISMWIILGFKTHWNFQYDDVESDGSDKNKSKHTSLLITNHGKIFKIKDDLATLAIINFIQSNGFEKSQQNYELLPMKTNPYGTMNKNFRYSTHSGRNRGILKNSNDNYYFENTSNNQSDDSDDGEYATFYRLKRSHSLNPKNKNRYSPLKVNKNIQDIDLTYQNSLNRKSSSTKMSTNVAYGLNMKQNSLISSMGSQHPDRISDISSGFHSNSSHSSLDDNDKLVLGKTDSLESLMQKIEEAAAERPNIRSISPLQKSTNMLTNTEPKTMYLQTFPNKVPELNKENIASSRLIEFAENPDYSKYYLPQVIVS